MTDPTLPFGDPCPRCGAASTNADPRDRICTCAACRNCGVPTGNLCGYCETSLGCRRHEVSIERHVQECCLATAAEREQIELLGDDFEAARALAIKIRDNAARPWPAHPATPPLRVVTEWPNDGGTT